MEISAKKIFIILRKLIPYLILTLSIILFFMPSRFFWTILPTPIFPLIVFYYFHQRNINFPNFITILLFGVYLDVLSNNVIGLWSFSVGIMIIATKYQIYYWVNIDKYLEIGIFALNSILFFISHWMINSFIKGDIFAGETLILQWFSTWLCYLIIVLGVSLFKQLTLRKFGDKGE